MFDSLGIGGGGSLIGGVACLLAPIPFIFYKYGKPIRERSKFAPTQKSEDEEKKEQGEERHPSDASAEEERELDEEQGVPDRRELEQQIKEERSESTLNGGKEGESGDRYLDASGMEKAER